MGANGRVTVRIAALVLAGTLVAAATAKADTELGEAGGFTYVTDSVSTVGVQVVEADCPPGTHVVGGGFNGGGFAVLRNEPFDGPDGDRRPDDGWRASRTVVMGGSSLEVFVICAESRPTYRRAKKSLAADETKTVKVPCPAATRVLAGGGRVGADLAIRAGYPYDDGDANSSPEDGWAVRAHGLDGSGNATANAICADTRPRYVPEEGTVPGSGFTLPRVDCPAARHVVGIGGRSRVPAANGGVTAAAPGDSTAGANQDADEVPDDRAALTFSSSGGGGPHELHAFAVCLRGGSLG